MNDETSTAIINRIHRTHAWILQTAEKLTEDELCQRFGPSAPPIGWHLWHIARWADRVQASLPKVDEQTDDQPNPNRGIWEQEQLVEQWDLDPATLGTLQEGSGMDFEIASVLPRHIGKEKLLAYVQHVFTATDAAVAALSPEQFSESRSSVMEYAYDTTSGKIWAAPGAQTTLAADLIFHVSHANRHLGMMEALSGLLDKKGTATV